YRRGARQGNRRQPAVDAAVAVDRTVDVRRGRPWQDVRHRERRETARLDHGPQSVSRHFRWAVERRGGGRADCAWRRVGGGVADLSCFTSAPKSSAYTAHLMDSKADAFFLAFSPALGLVFGYVWNPRDFPWMGIWEENCSRARSPWNGETVARGMEFGVSPFPET